MPALAFRSLLCRRKLYFPLFLVCAVCSGISFFVFFIIAGMSDAFQEKARLYYGGDLQFIGGAGALDFWETEKTMGVLRPLLPPETTLTSRVELGGDSCSFYYEGTEVVLWVVKGVDFKIEKNLFDALQFVTASGSEVRVPEIAGTNSILISKQIADRLGVGQGDVLQFFCRTLQGYVNSVDVQIAGVFSDPSVLGIYTAYCDVGCLRRAIGANADYSNRISFIFPREPSRADIAGFQEKLSERFTMYPLVSDKQAFYDDLLENRVFGDTPVYALITLQANQEELAEIMDAMETLFAFIVALLSLIIVVGIGSSYRVIVLKRVNEIGIYMSLGIRNSTISSLLFLEVMFLVVLGCVGGFAFSNILMFFSRYCDLSSIPGIDVFLQEGRLTASLVYAPVLGFSAVILVTTGLYVLFSIRKTMTISPVDAIRITE